MSKIERMYRIGEVARSLGVATHTVRFWEDQFGIRSSRNRGGQRVFSQAQLDRFIEIKHLLYVRMFTIAGARLELLAKSI